MIPEEIEAMIVRVLTDTAQSQEREKLSQWRMASAENEKIFQDYSRIFHLRDTQLPSFDAASDWDRLLKKIHSNARVARTPQYLRIAASVVLLIASLVIIREMVRERTIVHRADEHPVSVKMHDGSEVILRPNSVLTHTTSFNSTHRSVQLIGEAYFTVYSDNSKAFTVAADKAVIKVLGTSFMVRANPAKGNNSVEVREGRVSFSSMDNKSDSVVLTAGRRATLDKSSGRITVADISTENILAWKDRKIVFRKTTLREVVDVLENYFEINIDVENPLLLECTFTSTFVDPEVDEVLEALSVALNMTVTRTASGYTFRGEGCK